MTANRSHLAGLELALKILGGFTADQVSDSPYIAIQACIKEAQSAPEPVQGEAVAIANKGDVAFWVKWTEAGKHLRGPGIKLYTSPAKPDAELVASIREKFPRIDPCAPVPLDEKAHCCEYTIYVERERLHRLLDAKLAEVDKK